MTLYVIERHKRSLLCLKIYFFLTILFSCFNQIYLKVSLNEKLLKPKKLYTWFLYTCPGKILVKFCGKNNKIVSNIVKWWVTSNCERSRVMPQKSSMFCVNEICEKSYTTLQYRSVILIKCQDKHLLDIVTYKLRRF